MPKGGLAIMDLGSGAVARTPQVKSFRVPEKAGTVVAYLRAEKPTAGGAKGAAKEGQSSNEAGAAATTGEATTETRKPEKKKEYGSELVLRNPASGKERTFADVLDYVLSKDGSL